MITLGFAHITFSVSQHDIGVLEKVFHLPPSYRVRNSPEKNLFLTSYEATHNLFLSNFGVEINSHISTLKASTKELEELNTIIEGYKENRNVRRLNYSSDTLQFLSGIANISEYESSFELHSRPLLQSIHFFHDSHIFSSCNPFLDQFGLSSIALYVSEHLKAENAHKVYNVERISDPYIIVVGIRKYQIQFVRVGGVTFELIKRL